MTTYQTEFNLEASVTDLEAAQMYLMEDDMGLFLKNDNRCAGFSDKIVNIEWILDTESSGRIVLKTTEDLTKEQLYHVSDWVRGQNADGLGEGFEQQDFANYRNPDWEEEDDEDLYQEEEWLMASFDWQTNDYEFEKVEE